MIRTDSGCGTREFLNWLTPRGRWPSNAVGMTITDTVHHAVLKIQASAWTPSVEPGCEIRDGAWVAELAGDCLTGWRMGMRLIVRKEPILRRPTPRHRRRRHAHRLLLPTSPGRYRPQTEPPPAHPLRGPHPQRPCHRAAQPPLHNFAPNQIWLEIGLLLSLRPERVQDGRGEPASPDTAPVQRGSRTPPQRIPSSLRADVGALRGDPTGTGGVGASVTRPVTS